VSAEAPTCDDFRMPATPPIAVERLPPATRALVAS